MEFKPKYDYSKLKGKIVENGFSNKTFAKAVGMSISSLYNKFACNSYFTQDEIELIKKVLRLKDSEVVLIFFTLKVKKN